MYKRSFVLIVCVVLLLPLFTSCSQNQSSENINDVINNASDSLDAFQEALIEIQNNTDYMDDYEYSSTLTSIRTKVNAAKIDYEEFSSDGKNRKYSVSERLELLQDAENQLSQANTSFEMLQTDYISTLDDRYNKDVQNIEECNELIALSSEMENLDQESAEYKEKACRFAELWLKRLQSAARNSKDCTITEESKSIITDYQKDSNGEYTIPIYEDVDYKLFKFNDVGQEKMYRYEVLDNGKVRAKQIEFAQAEKIFNEDEEGYFNSKGEKLVFDDNTIYVEANNKSSKGVYAANKATSKLIGCTTKDLSEFSYTKGKDSMGDTFTATKYYPSDGGNAKVTYSHDSKGITETHTVRCVKYDVNYTSDSYIIDDFQNIPSAKHWGPNFFSRLTNKGCIIKDTNYGMFTAKVGNTIVLCKRCYGQANYFKPSYHQSMTDIVTYSATFEDDYYQLNADYVPIKKTVDEVKNDYSYVINMNDLNKAKEDLQPLLSRTDSLGNFNVVLKNSAEDLGQNLKTASSALTHYTQAYAANNNKQLANNTEPSQTTEEPEDNTVDIQAIIEQRNYAQTRLDNNEKILSLEKQLGVIDKTLPKYNSLVSQLVDLEIKKYVIAQKDNLSNEIAINNESKNLLVGYEKDASGNYVLNDSSDFVPIYQTVDFKTVTVDGDDLGLFQYDVKDDGSIIINKIEIAESQLVPYAQARYINSTGQVYIRNSENAAKNYEYKIDTADGLYIIPRTKSIEELDTKKKTYTKERTPHYSGRYEQWDVIDYVPVSVQYNESRLYKVDLSDLTPFENVCLNTKEITEHRKEVILENTISIYDINEYYKLLEQVKSTNNCLLLETKLDGAELGKIKYVIDYVEMSYTDADLKQSGPFFVCQPIDFYQHVQGKTINTVVSNITKSPYLTVNAKDDMPVIQAEIASLQDSIRNYDNLYNENYQLELVDNENAEKEIASLPEDEVPMAAEADHQNNWLALSLAAFLVVVASGAGVVIYKRRKTNS